MTSTLAFRHLFASAGGGRSLAWSDSLELVLGELEELVTGHQVPDGAAGPQVSRQVVPMYDPNYYALTTLTSSGAGAMEYWAETFVVPSAWLQAGEWDLDAALTALPWRGPEDPSSVSEPGPSVGTGEEIATLESGPLARLEALRRAVPRERLGELIVAVMRVPRHRHNVGMVEAEGGEPSVGELVSLLPLLLPPGARSFRSEAGARTFRLRTWTLPGHGPAVDFAGIPSASAEAAENQEGILIDLGGARRPSHPADVEEYEYARWMAEVITAGDWHRLEEAYASAAEPEAAALFLQSFPVNALGAAAQRRLAEEAKAALDRHAQQVIAEIETAAEQRLRSLDGDLARRFDSERERLRREVDRSASALQEALATRGKRLMEDLARQHAEATQKPAVGLGAVATAGTPTPPATDLAPPEHGRGLRVRKTKIRRWIDQGPLRRTGRRAPKGSRAPGSRVAAFAPRLPVSRWLNRLRERLPRWPPRWYWTAGTLTMSAGVLLYLFLPRDPGPLPTDGRTTPRNATRAAELTERLQDGALAARLLARASELPTTSEAASTLFLDLYLDEAGAAPEEVSTALVQHLLGGITVDGVFGAATHQNLLQQIEPSCCGGLAASGRQRSCFLSLSLDLDSARACAGLDPFGEAEGWGFEAAENLLHLVRSTRRVVSSSAEADFWGDVVVRGHRLGAELDLYDLAHAEDQLERALEAGNTRIDGEEAERLLRLARMVAGQSTWSDVPPEQNPGELYDVAALLDDLEAASSEAPVSPGRF